MLILKKVEFSDSANFGVLYHSTKPRILIFVLTFARFRATIIVSIYIFAYNARKEYDFFKNVKHSLHTKKLRPYLKIRKRDTMENVKEIIAKNLAELRKEKKYTQQQIAERLNYSDKAVSRWEHAETMPDLETLCKLCDIYGVKFEYLLQADQPKKNNPYVVKTDMPGRIVVLLIAALAIWIAAMVAYTYMHIIFSQNKWTIFIWAIPTTSVTCQICNAFLLHNRPLKYILTSITAWTLLLSLYLELLSYNVWMLFIIGIPIQIIIILLAILKTKKNT